MGLIYLDTCLLIYLVEAHPVHAPRLTQLFSRSPLKGFAISPLVKLECLVGPSKAADLRLQRRYQEVFGRMTTLGMPESVYLDAAAIRGRFGLKTPDALHLACAHHHGCTGLWTRDDRLLRAARGMARNVLV